MFAVSKNRDNEKAIRLLKQAIEITGLEDVEDVRTRLKNLYKDIGMNEEADAIELEVGNAETFSSEPNIDNNTGRKINKDFIKTVLERTSKEGTFTSVKIGRNDPCPCGSGKKYKKCCGR